MKARLTAIALLTLPSIAIAQSNQAYDCSMGGLDRRIAVEREGQALVPCEVAYYKDSEAPGQREVLWNAANDVAYCSARAAELASRLEGLGWTCVAANAAQEPARSEDDAD